MIKPVLSTYKILKEKAFNSDIDESWVDWALEMMQAGFESDSLYQLAGISKPYNQFELQDLTNKVLKELHLDYSDKESAIRNYVYYLISNAIDAPEKYLETLRELKNICIDLDMAKEYMDFYLLYFAKDDLLEIGSQHYWDGADSANIDTIIKEQFGLWKQQFEAEIKS
ncbi:hypothetical protein ACFQ4C_30455 [Larkinella insperata]|uniref:DUF2247 family protein n=1 Tax=Larkinella insperata TaxID=332158 RepID=A0ABW3QCS1_9BACT